MASTADIGVIGLGVMGRNLVLNLTDHGYSVAVFNRTVERVDEFLAGEPGNHRLIGTRSVEELVSALQRPRRVLMMIQAGSAVDGLIEALLPLLEGGDVLIDGGNSLYTDTIRRTAQVERFGVNYVGMGISGGEEGARFGPSIMPGGSEPAWPVISEVFRAVAAEADGEPVAAWLGPDGAGHFVKMVHNGIEYGDMQVIAEAYDILRRGLGMTALEIQSVFAEWNSGPLDSYLIEITADILGVRDGDGEPLVDHILDAAGQKGTGKWTVIASMDQGMPTSLVAEAVYARIVAALVPDRRLVAAAFSGPPPNTEDPVEEVIADLHDALYASKIVSYAQGFMLLASAAADYGWALDLATVASLWRAGCIIRSRFLDDIMHAFRVDPTLPNLLLDPFFRDAITAAQAGWRRTVARGIRTGIPVPAYASALAFFDAYRTQRLPANLIQAQRDYFGAHTYERVDHPRGTMFHTDWGSESPDAGQGDRV